MQTILRRLSLLLALLVALAGCAAAEAVPNPREEVADASAVETVSNAATAPAMNQTDTNCSVAASKITNSTASPSQTKLI